MHLAFVTALLLDPDNRKVHGTGFFLLIVVSAFAITYQVWHYYSFGHPARGSDGLPFVFGVVGGLIIFFEFALWPRKACRRLIGKIDTNWLERRKSTPWAQQIKRCVGTERCRRAASLVSRLLVRVKRIRVGAARYWMAAHVWLGLLSLPLLLAHSGLRFNGLGNFNSWLTIVLIAVFFSGIYGWYRQLTVPKKMLREVKDETIYSQIEHVANRIYRDADELVDAVCGRWDEDKYLQKTPDLPINIVGRPREEMHLDGFQISSIPLDAIIPNANILSDAFRDEIGPFLSTGKKGENVDLRSEASLAEYFTALREDIFGRDEQRAMEPDPLSLLERWCDIRRQHLIQKRLHRKMHGWLLFHVPLSLLLLVMMLIHVVYALMYL